MSVETFELFKTYPTHGWKAIFHGAPRIKALSNISLRAEEGCIIGLAGPNGSGKTTLLKLLAGRLLPDHGKISLDGKAISADARELRRAAAFCGQGGSSFHLRLSALENLDFFGALYGFSRAEVRTRAAAFFSKLQIPPLDAEKRFSTLSEGAMQKFSLIRALMLDSSLILLDEPARALDTATAARLPALLRELAHDQGKMIFYAAHNPTELARTADRTLILKNGTIAAEITGPDANEPRNIEAALTDA